MQTVVTVVQQDLPQKLQAAVTANRMTAIFITNAVGQEFENSGKNSLKLIVQITECVNVIISQKCVKKARSLVNAILERETAFVPPL